MRRTFLVLRPVVALLVLAAILAQLRSTLAFAGRDGRRETGAELLNFFSFFTVDSNALTVVVLLVAALSLRRGGPDSRGLTTVRLALTTYMLITAVVYNLLLRGLPLAQGVTVAWSNEVLHLVAPTYVVLDWFLAPGRPRLRPRDALPVLVFPVVWLVWTLLRGPFARDPFRDRGHWYPYPFLDPVASAGGYASVAAYVVGITVVTVLVAVGLARVSRPTPRPRS